MLDRETAESTITAAPAMTRPLLVGEGYWSSGLCPRQGLFPVPGVGLAAAMAAGLGSSTGLAVGVLDSDEDFARGHAGARLSAQSGVSLLHFVYAARSPLDGEVLAYPQFILVESAPELEAALAAVAGTRLPTLMWLAGMPNGSGYRARRDEPAQAVVRLHALTRRRVLGPNQVAAAGVGL